MKSEMGNHIDLVKENEVKIEALTARLVQTFSKDSSRDLSFLYDNGILRCMVCDNNKELECENYQSEICLEESYKACPVCGLKASFAYGFYTASIEGIDWDWSYNEEKDSDIQKKRMSEMKVVAHIFYKANHEMSLTQDELHYVELLETRMKLNPSEEDLYDDDDDELEVLDYDLLKSHDLF